MSESNSCFGVFIYLCLSRFIRVVNGCIYLLRKFSVGYVNRSIPEITPAGTLLGASRVARPEWLTYWSNDVSVHSVFIVSQS